MIQQRYFVTPNERVFHVSSPSVPRLDVMLVVDKAKYQSAMTAVDRAMRRYLSLDNFFGEPYMFFITDELLSADVEPMCYSLAFKDDMFDYDDYNCTSETWQGMWEVLSAAPVHCMAYSIYDDADGNRHITRDIWRVERRD